MHEAFDLHNLLGVWLPAYVRTWHVARANSLQSTVCVCVCLRGTNVSELLHTGWNAKENLPNKPQLQGTARTLGTAVPSRACLLLWRDSGDAGK